MPDESRFTAPTAECLHPELWHSTDGQSAESEVTDLVAAFVTALQPEYVVETGSAFGQTAQAIGAALAGNCHGELVSLEINENTATIAASRCEGLPVRVLNMSSLQFTPEKTVDFAWFDSEVHLRTLEFHRYYPHMSIHTVVGFHDTGPQHGLRPAVEGLERVGKLKAIYLPTPRGVAFGRVETGGLRR